FQVQYAVEPFLCLQEPATSPHFDFNTWKSLLKTLENSQELIAQLAILQKQRQTIESAFRDQIKEVRQRIVPVLASPLAREKLLDILNITRLPESRRELDSFLGKLTRIRRSLPKDWQSMEKRLRFVGSQLTRVSRFINNNLADLKRNQVRLIPQFQQMTGEYAARLHWEKSIEAFNHAVVLNDYPRAQGICAKLITDLLAMSPVSGKDHSDHTQVSKAKNLQEATATDIPPQEVGQRMGNLDWFSLYALTWLVVPEASSSPPLHQALRHYIFKQQPEYAQRLARGYAAIALQWSTLLKQSLPDVSPGIPQSFTRSERVHHHYPLPYPAFVAAAIAHTLNNREALSLAYGGNYAAAAKSMSQFQKLFPKNSKTYKLVAVSINFFLEATSMLEQRLDPSLQAMIEKITANIGSPTEKLAWENVTIAIMQGDFRNAEKALRRFMGTLKDPRHLHPLCSELLRTLQRLRHSQQNRSLPTRLKMAHELFQNMLLHTASIPLMQRGIQLFVLHEIDQAIRQRNLYLAALRCEGLREICDRELASMLLRLNRLLVDPNFGPILWESDWQTSSDKSQITAAQMAILGNLLREGFFTCAEEYSKQLKLSMLHKDITQINAFLQKLDPLHQAILRKLQGILPVPPTSAQLKQIAAIRQMILDNDFESVMTALEVLPDDTLDGLRLLRQMRAFERVYLDNNQIPNLIRESLLQANFKTAAMLCARHPQYRALTPTIQKLEQWHNQFIQTMIIRYACCGSLGEEAGFERIIHHLQKAEYSRIVTNKRFNKLLTAETREKLFELNRTHHQ
ncbi:MAG: hypothetical protein D6820_15085, partial [Lentisphaerae bacterium]